MAQTELGLDYYVARWYDPVLGHFTQADTLVPEPGKASAYDRYAYAQNNPLKYSDPSGHCVFCVVFSAVVIGITAVLITPFVEQIVKEISNPEVKNDYKTSGCNQSLASCHERGSLSTLNEGTIPDDEFYELLETVSTDLEEGNTLPGEVGGLLTGRDRYDTPFYNGGGVNGNSDIYPSNQQVCIENNGCWGRSEINYVAQGIWSSETGERLDTALNYTETWNSQYSDVLEDVLQAKLYWTEYGYEWYENKKEWKKKWRPQWEKHLKDEEEEEND